MGQRSNWWYLAPIIFGLVGGILGYFGIRKDDPKKAKNILALGIIIFVCSFLWSDDSDWWNSNELRKYLSTSINTIPINSNFIV